MNDEAKVAALQELYDADKLTAEDVVEAARDPEHPCHNEIEWDLSVAGYQYQLQQARALIGRMRVYIQSSTVEVQTRMFLRPPSSKQYLDGDKAVANFRDELVEQCFRHVRSTVVKFRRLGDDELRTQFERALTAD